MAIDTDEEIKRKIKVITHMMLSGLRKWQAGAPRTHYTSLRDKARQELFDLIKSQQSSNTQELTRDKVALEERRKARQFYAKRKPLFTRQWIADALGISRPTLNKWIDNPELFTIGAVRKLVALDDDREEKQENYVDYESLAFFSEMPIGEHEYLQDLSSAKAGDN